MTLDADSAAMIAIGVAAGSEIIALSPLKANGWVQLVLQVARLVFPKR
jgi:hypothetical protein